MSRFDGVPNDRRERLDEFLDRRKLAAVWFARPNSFAWLTGGDNVVDRAAPTGVAAAGYDGEDVRVVTNNIEAERLRDEELPPDVVVDTYDWYERSLADALDARSPEPAAADFDVPGFGTVDPPGLRQPLSAGDVQRYRELGTEVTSALEAVCRAASPADTERAIAARLRGTLAETGIDASVALVGGGERARSYRHYTPTAAELEEYALVSVSAARAGLVASCTRTVAFEEPEWLRDRHTAAARVEATALAATQDAGRDGGTAGDVFEAVRTAYGTLGWDGEWERHHQGGAAGFAGREWIATPSLAAPVHLPMGYAWNPTVQGAKSEGTVLVEEEGFERLTAGEWPTESVGAIGYDESFERPTVLSV